MTQTEPSPLQTYRRFEDLCAAILIDAGYGVQRDVATNLRGMRIDIVATSAEDDEPRRIEVKYSNLPSVSLGQLRDWSARVAGILGNEDENHPALARDGIAGATLGAAGFLCPT